MLRNAKKDLMVNYCSFMVWRLKKLQQRRNIVFHHDMHTFIWTKVTEGVGGVRKTLNLKQKFEMEVGSQSNTWRRVRDYWKSSFSLKILISNLPGNVWQNNPESKDALSGHLLLWGTHERNSAKYCDLTVKRNVRAGSIQALLTM